MKQVLAIFLLFAFSVTSAHAEVTNTADNGFTVKHQAEVAADSETIWKSLIAPAKWWNGEHSFSGNAENFYLVPQAGGCFCELIRTKTEDNIKSSAGSVQHMRVIFVSNGKAMRLSGALGPLQGEALNGTLTIQLQPNGDKTAVRFTYKVGGYMEFKVDEIAPAVDGVIGEQLSRLAALFSVDESGDEADEGQEASDNDEDGEAASEPGAAD